MLVGGDGLSDDRNQDGNIKYMRGELVWVAVVSWVSEVQGGVFGRALLFALVLEVKIHSNL